MTHHYHQIHYHPPTTVGSSQSVFVRVCDSFGSCSSSEAFNITICDLPSAIASDRVADLLDEVMINHHNQILRKLLCQWNPKYHF